MEESKQSQQQLVSGCHCDVYVRWLPLQQLTFTRPLLIGLVEGFCGRIESDTTSSTAQESLLFQQSSYFGCFTPLWWEPAHCGQKPFGGNDAIDTSIWVIDPLRDIKTMMHCCTVMAQRVDVVSMSAKGNFAKTGDDDWKNVAIVSKLQVDLLNKGGDIRARKQI